MNSIPEIGLTAFCALAFATIAEAQPITFQFNANTQITTQTVDADGLLTTDTTPAGASPAEFFQRTISVGASSAFFYGPYPFGEGQAVRLSNSVTANDSRFPARATSGPTDILINTTVSVPGAYVIMIDLTEVVDPGTSVGAQIDVFDDGTIDLAAANLSGTSSFEVVIPAGTTMVPIRVVSTAFAAAPSSGVTTGLDLNASTMVVIRAEARCQPQTELTANCSAGMTFLQPFVRLNGMARHLVAGVHGPGTARFLVIGFSTLSAPFSLGNCDLAITPDIVIPFDTPVGAIARVDVETAGLPASQLQFFTQGVSIDPLQGVGTGPAWSFFCR